MILIIIGFLILEIMRIQELFSNPKLELLINKGLATPDHVIRTKAKPLLLETFKPSRNEI